MDTKIVTVFCLCDDMLKALKHNQDPQCQMTDAEVMTTAIIAALLFGETLSMPASIRWMKAIFLGC